MRLLLTSATTDAIRDSAVSGGIAGDVAFPHRDLLYMRLKTMG